MKRYMGLDIGDHTVGIAISDPLGLTAQGIETIRRKDGEMERPLQRIGELMQEYFITAFPTTFLIDREGDLFGYVPGAMPREFMDDAIRQTLESTQDG